MLHHAAPGHIAFVIPPPCHRHYTGKQQARQAAALHARNKPVDTAHKVTGTVSKVPRLGEQSQNGSSVSSFEAFVHTYETCVYINESFVLTLCQTQSNFTPHIMRFMSDAMQVSYFRLVSPPETAAASHRRKCKSPCLSPSAPSKIVTCHTVTKQQHHICCQAKAGT